METDWVLVANAHRARIFTRRGPGAALTEVASYFFPRQRGAPGGDPTGDAGKGHGRTAHAGTQFEPHTEVDTVDRHAFARQLADVLDDAVAARRCKRIAMVASAPMLGALRSLLGHAALQALTETVERDLTIYQGADLRQRVDAALMPAQR